MASRVVVRDKKFGKWMQDYNLKVTTGVHRQEGAAKHQSAEDDETTKVIDVAVWNEFGITVPERSFVRRWFDEEKHDVFRLAGKQLTTALRASGGDNAPKLERNVERALERTALASEAAMRKRVINGILPENAESTKAKKGSATPLVDTSQLLGSMRGKGSLSVKNRRKA